MTDVSTFDSLMDRLDAGQPLTGSEIAELATTPDILPLGMLADALRRRLHDTQVTYLRVATCAYDQPFTDAALPAARELRITGTPGSLAIALEAVAQAKAVAGNRLVAGFSWTTIEALAQETTTGRVLAELRTAGLDALAELAIDTVPDVAAALEQLTAAGYGQVRLTVEKAAPIDRPQLFLRAAELQDRFACIQAISPLASTPGSFRPTTGYDDVKMVAIARLAAPNIPTVQVDWRRYGPKLAQVALTFGADDLDGVSASDEAPEGRRRAPLEEVRRNIEAAGFTPAERDGGFAIVNRES